MWQAGTDTTLAADLNNGDSVIVLTDATNWNDSNAAPTYQRGISIYGYTNSGGFTYDDYTYTRDYFWDLWVGNGSINFGTNTITLTTTWSGGFFAAGTAVTNSSSGGTYIYPISNQPTPPDWTVFANDIQGLPTIPVGNSPSNKFRYGTAFVRPGFLLNRDTTSPTTTLVDAVSFGLALVDQATIDGKVNVAGDSMTGDLTIQHLGVNAAVIVRSSTARGVAGSSQFRMEDSAGSRFGRLLSNTSTAGVQMDIYNADGATVDANFIFQPDGNIATIGTLSAPQSINDLTRKDYVDDNFVDLRQTTIQEMSGDLSITTGVNPALRIYSSVASSVGFRIISVAGTNALIDVIDNAGAFGANVASFASNGVATFAQNPISTNTQSSSVNALTKKSYVDDNFVDLGQTTLQTLSGKLAFNQIISTDGTLQLYSGSTATGYAIGVESSTLFYRANGNHRWYLSTLADAGVSDYMNLDVNGLTVNGTVTTTGGVNALKSATTAVSVSAATAPTTGQVLTATSGTAANWQDAGGGGEVLSIKVNGTTGAKISGSAAMGVTKSQTGRYIVTHGLGHGNFNCVATRNGSQQVSIIDENSAGITVYMYAIGTTTPQDGWFSLMINVF